MLLERVDRVQRLITCLTTKSYGNSCRAELLVLNRDILFSDAKLPEKAVQEVLARSFADNLADGADGDP